MVSQKFLVVCAMISGVISASTLSQEPPTTFGTSPIVSGEEVTSVIEFPHQLSLRYIGQDWHTCGASIIAENWAITAAHCVDGESTTSFKVVGNFVDRQHETNAFTLYLTEIIMHEDYNVGSGAHPNDVALLRLASSPPNVADLKIKVADESSGTFETSTNCQITGWSRLVNGSISQVLQKADVLVLSVQECKRQWGIYSTADHICVLGNVVDGVRSGACNGDSGGPLTCYESDGTPVLAGLASWVQEGCHVDGHVTHPAVYTRTSSYYDWIQTNCDNCL